MIFLSFVTLLFISSNAFARPVSQASPTPAGCTRGGLKAVAQSFMSVSATKSPLGYLLAPGVKITENAQPLHKVQDGLLAQVSLLHESSRVLAVSPETCEVAMILMARLSDLDNSTSSTPSTQRNATISIRLRAPNDTKPSEVEIVSLPCKDLEMNPLSWASHQYGKMMAGDRLYRAAIAYSSGGSAIAADDPVTSKSKANKRKRSTSLAAPQNSNLAIGCQAFINGDNTNRRCEAIMGPSKEGVRDSRWFADNETGVVWSSLLYHPPKNSKTDVLQNIFYKVADGKLVGMQGLTENVPLGISDPWKVV
jgi:hypothetical protein